jgi:hypothetical protein
VKEGSIAAERTPGIKGRPFRYRQLAPGETPALPPRKGKTRKQSTSKTQPEPLQAAYVAIEKAIEALAGDSTLGGMMNDDRNAGRGMDILDAIRDPELFGPWFQDTTTWKSWRTFIGALFALPVEDKDLYGRCTGGRPLPTKQAREAFLVVGRRGGKSFVCAMVGVFLATFRSYKLSPGERGVVMLLAADRRQARVLFRYAQAFLEGVPMLKTMVERVTADTIELSNGIILEIHTASFRSVRGYTIVAALCDEISYWRSDESANPDTEILNALRPAMATIPDSMLLCLSTPYSRRGALWDAHRRYFGKGGDTLIWQAPTRTMNPCVPESVIDNAYEEET